MSGSSSASGTWTELTMTIGADALQMLFYAGPTEGAFVGADHGCVAVGGQGTVTAFTFGFHLEHGCVLSEVVGALLYDRLLKHKGVRGTVFSAG